jgi:iron complex outermembrane receptor protein
MCSLFRNARKEPAMRNRNAFQARPLVIALATCFSPLHVALAQTANPEVPAPAASAASAPPATPAASAASAPAASAPAAPPAATPEGSQLPTVTVTAQRTTENIKDVPLSVTTLSGEKLDVLSSGGQDVRALSNRVPSLNIESSFGRAFPRFYIRGYGNPDFRANASQPVSLVYDDIVLENPLLKGFPIFDLDRVEVLTGPQGTLFGRNTPAGVVKFDSAKPRIGATDGFANVSFGTYKTTNTEAAVSIPMGETMAARVSMLYQYRDDWVHNTVAGPTQDYEGYKDGAVRAQLLYKPSGDFSALFNVHGRNLDGTARLFRANIIKPGTNDLVDGFDETQVSLDGRNEQNIDSYGTNAHLTWDLGDYALHSITGYETVKTFSRGDIDGGYGAAFAPPSGPGTIPFPSETAGALRDHGQFTQEFRIESKYSGPFNWQSGLYYFDEKFTSNTHNYDTLAGGAETSVLTDTQKSKSYAVFGSVRYDLTPQWVLRGGLRYTHDKKELVSDAAALPDSSREEGTSASLSDSKPSGDISAMYKINPSTNVYARLATGYRGSSVQPASLFATQSLAGQENTVSYEAGVKSDLFDKRARLSASVFQYQVKDLQLTEVGGTTNSNILLSADKVVGQGFELSLDAYLTDQFLITVSGSYNDTKIKDPNLAVSGCGNGCTVTDPSNGSGRFLIDGNQLPNAPKWVGNVTARYAIPVASGEVFVYTDWAYRSKVNLFLYESVEGTGKPLLEGGLRIGYIWDNGKYEVAAFGRNITNKVVTTGAIDFNNLTGFVNDPRTFGVQFKAAF